MRVGLICNWGGNNGCHNYGFITPLISPNEYNLFFHISAVPHGSKLRTTLSKANTEHVYVLYELDTDVSRAKYVISASDVLPERMLSELIDEDIIKSNVYQNYLRSNFPRLFLKDDPMIYIENFHDEYIRTLYFRRLKNGYFKEKYIDTVYDYILNRSNKYINNYAINVETCISNLNCIDEEHEKIAEICRKIIEIGCTPKKLIMKCKSLLYEDGICSNISHNDLYEILRELTYTQEQLTLILNAVSNRTAKIQVIMQMDPYYLIENVDLYKYYDGEVLNKIINECNFDDVEAIINKLELFAVSLLKNYCCIHKLINKVPQLIDNDEIASKIRYSDIIEIIKCKIVTEHQLLNVALINRDKSVRETILHDINENTLLKSNDCYELIDDEIGLKIVKLIEWADTSYKNIDVYKDFIMHIEADEKPETAIYIAEHMYNLDIMLKLKWWNVFTESLMIRCLLYFSNFLDGSSTQLKNYGLLMKDAIANNRKLVITTIKFIYIKFHYDYETINIAHKSIIKYILDCFNNEIDVTHALNVLLDKCQSSDNFGIFCDARPWKNVDGIYCPMNKTKCTHYEKCDLGITQYERTKQYKYQHLTDLLKNVCDANAFTLVDGYYYAPWEYPYKISGFVNSLVAMRPHMRCRCGKHFVANFKYAKKITAALSCTVFDCPMNNEAEENSTHDKNVYINYCYRCHNIIDSRECKIQDSRNYYLCMTCGGSYDYDMGEKCPNCGCVDTSKIIFKKAGNLIQCKNCGHNLNNTHKVPIAPNIVDENY